MPRCLLESWHLLQPLRFWGLELKRGTAKAIGRRKHRVMGQLPPPRAMLRIAMTAEAQQTQWRHLWAVGHRRARH